MSRAFLAYAREDVEKAGTVVQTLKDTGVDVFWDEDLTSEDWRARLESEIRDRDHFVLLLSGHSAASVEVLSEYLVAREAHAVVHVIDLGGAEPERVEPHLRALEWVPADRVSKVAAVILQQAAEHSGPQRVVARRIVWWLWPLSLLLSIVLLFVAASLREGIFASEDVYASLVPLTCVYLTVATSLGALWLRPKRMPNRLRLSKSRWFGGLGVSVLYHVVLLAIWSDALFVQSYAEIAPTMTFLDWQELLLRAGLLLGMPVVVGLTVLLGAEAA